MNKKININAFKVGKCLNSRELIKSLINDETDVELIIVNPDEEYEKIKNSIIQSSKCELRRKINPFSVT